MKLLAKEPGASQLALVQSDPSSAPDPLNKAPKACGFAVHRHPHGLVMAVPYDGCQIMQKGGCYMLPMHWQGIPITLSCPKQTISPRGQRHAVHPPRAPAEPPATPEAATPAPAEPPQAAMKPSMEDFQRFLRYHTPLFQNAGPFPPQTTAAATTTTTTEPEPAAPQPPADPSLQLPEQSPVWTPPHNGYPFGPHQWHPLWPPRYQGNPHWQHRWHPLWPPGYQGNPHWQHRWHPLWPPGYQGNPHWQHRWNPLWPPPPPPYPVPYPALPGSPHGRHAVHPPRAPAEPPATPEAATPAPAEPPQAAMPPSMEDFQRFLRYHAPRFQNPGPFPPQTTAATTTTTAEPATAAPQPGKAKRLRRTTAPSPAPPFDPLYEWNPLLMPPYNGDPYAPQYQEYSAPQYQFPGLHFPPTMAELVATAKHPAKMPSSAATKPTPSEEWPFELPGR
ncbi:unnamed protein product [Lota lota]